MVGIMEGIKTFLESSTIHGLSYIATTRKYARFFWIIVVLAGFSTAGYLIQQSFQSWADSPVKTTVETLPISEITFPKITVCPPRNTFTDLNYDLMLSENVSLAETVPELDKNLTVEYEYDYFLGMAIPINGFKTKTKNTELIEFASQVINEHLYFDDWTNLEEENRFYNWYHGYTKISDPKHDKNVRFKYTIDTSAASGVVSTKYFGERISDALVEKFCEYQINIHIPDHFKDNFNVTFHINLETAPISKESKSTQNIFRVDGKLVGDEQLIHYKFTPTSSSYMIYYYLDIKSGSADLGETKMMPGFRVRWWYTGSENKSYGKFLNDTKTKNLRRLAI